jgi:hypothetical protein
MNNDIIALENRKNYAENFERFNKEYKVLGIVNIKSLETQLK